jgi:hypothetical protein
VRISLKTRDLQRAARRLTEIEDRASGRPRKSTTEAIEAFHAQHHADQSETKRKYKRILGFFGDFCTQAEIHYVDRVRVEDMDRYALWRNKENWTRGQRGRTAATVLRVLPRSGMDDEESRP